VQVGVLEEELLGVLAVLEPRVGRVPFYSTARGGFVGTEELNGEYWYANLRGQVGFEEAVRELAEQGASRFIEVSPHPVLVSAVTETVQEVEGADQVRVLGSLRRREGGPARFTVSLAEAYVGGAPVDWAGFFAGSGAGRVGLPSYAFQRSRYWLPLRSGGGDLAGAGLGRLGHPMLSAAVRVGDRDEWVFTGRVSQEAQPWTTDHAVFGMVIVPGAALVELALAAGGRVDCPVVEELVLQVPLLLSEGEALDLQVTVGAPDEDGRRDIAIYTAPAGNSGQDTTQPTCHARGTLTPDSGLPTDTDWTATWPPEDAEPVSVDDLYERLAGLGYDYGPSFKGLHTAWAQNEYIYAEVALPDDHIATARQYGIHPGLLDASLHSGLTWLDKGGDHAVQLPFSWSGVRLGQPGSAQVRVRIASTADSTLRVDIADEHGELVVSAEQLTFRPVDQTQLEGARRPEAGSLYTVDWIPVARAADHATPRMAGIGELTGAGEHFADLDALLGVVAVGASVPDVVVVGVGVGTEPGPDEEAHAARVVAARVLGLVQEWLAAEALSESRLVLVTRGAVSVGDESPDVAAAAAWGLVRSAQSEHPGRFVLVDLDPAEEGGETQPDWAALAGFGESQVAVREGRTLAPRLTRAAETALPEGPWRLSPVEKGSLEGLALVASDAGRPLEAGEVRIAVRAAGLNFRDVLITLGVYPGDAPLGSEAAGVVLETGSAVTDLAPGDRVMGLILESFGTAAIADGRMVVRMPVGWSFEQAAAVPVVYLTAYYGLVELGQLVSGE
ncbi:polyketide synthase dehydratase domain-containing protein, partial [Streptomyces sp. NPDC005492]|uniref:polyketide synthase dehydratase domain-containing protein n=1 Tax=Streptomyces sp. NPDC005492 TaxID=3156883 RepID=UPI0033B1855C